ncbi:type 2 lactosamine alpha-2,3-sialyltransferase isoform X2 [Amia ocellicauda]|uniref:type 2 lactosamine alpha-2,3-sialyltransferase isoform X2 n=1 Tax=Amia ocellicauda TaxID=2972642 RepID=UPI003463F087
MRVLFDPGVGAPSSEYRHPNMFKMAQKKITLLLLILPCMMCAFFLREICDYIFTGPERRSNPFLCLQDLYGDELYALSQDYPLPYGIRNAEYGLQVVLKNMLNCEIPKEVKYEKCIVVGSGSILKNKHLGPDIDAFDVVIRLNDAPLRGYEADVGKKTTFRLFYPESYPTTNIDYDPQTVGVIVLFKPMDIRWLINVLRKKTVNPRGFWKTPASRLFGSPSRIRILNPLILNKFNNKYLHYPQHEYKGQSVLFPTSGMIGIAMALHMCESVSIAGFHYDFHSNDYLHYYGYIRMSYVKEMFSHDIPAEQLILQRLKQSELISDLHELKKNI